MALPPAWQRPHDATYPRSTPVSNRFPPVLAKICRINPKTVAKWRSSAYV